MSSTLSSPTSTARRGGARTLSDLSAPKLDKATQNALVGVHRAGCDAAGRLDAPLLVDVLERERLERLVARGHAAQEELVASVYRLLVKIVREHTSRRYGSEAPRHFDDVMGEALVETMNALEAFDPDRGMAFSSWVSIRVNGHLRSSLARSAGTGVPVIWYTVARLAVGARSEMSETLGREPTLGELRDFLRAQALAWAMASHLDDETRARPLPERVRAAEKWLRGQGTLGAIEKLEQVLLATSSSVSLDADLFDDGGDLATFAGLVTADATERVIHDDYLARVRAVLEPVRDSLTANQQKVMDNLMAEEPRTHADIAAEVGLSREGVRQLEWKVRSRLLHPITARKLLDL